MEIGHLKPFRTKKRCAECLGSSAPKSRLQTQLCFLESMLKIEEFRLPKKKINIPRPKKKEDDLVPALFGGRVVTILTQILCFY